MSLSVITPSASDPVSLAEAKAHLRVDYTTDDALITALITAATDYAERYTRKSLVNKTYRYIIDTFPFGPLELPRQPIQTVTADGVTYTYDMPRYQYYANDGTLSTLTAGTDFEPDYAFNPPRLMLPPSKYWPLTQPAKRNAVIIDFVAGYSADATKVPEGIKLAIKMIVGSWYENRTSISDVSMSEVPFACRALLDIHKAGDYQYHQIGGFQ